MQLLKRTGSALVLIALALVILWVFGGLRGEGSLGSAGTELTANSPLSTPTPIVRPIATSTVYSEPIIPPGNYVTPVHPTPVLSGSLTPGPFVPAKGGPYISEAEALQKGLKAAAMYGAIESAIRPTAVFTASKNIRKVVGDPDRLSRSEREMWIVGAEGRFSPLRGPAGRPDTVFRKIFLVFDATTGFPEGMIMKEQVQ